MALIHSCSRMGDDERSAFLDAECAEDGDLRRQVEILLAEKGGPTGQQIIEHHLAKALPDHYRMIGLIGSGGMADVFLAEDTRLDRRVAIKFLNDTFRKDPERMRRFKQEARSASSLNHPNIITIHDIGEKDGVQYIVSEFVEGQTLGTRIASGPLPPEEALVVAIQIASALSAAHKSGIIHRDLKPDNIMLRPDGSVKVVDFGLAKGHGAISGQSDRDEQTIEIITTSPGLILGTPKYMSPEQTRGEPLDGRTDIFSFGLILFEMLTGHAAFKASNVVDMIAAIIGKPHRRLDEFVPGLPEGIQRIVDKCLEKEREQRYETADELLADLRQTRNALVEKRVDPGGNVGASARRGNFWRVAAALLTVSAIAAGLWWTFGRSKSPTAVVTSWRSVAITSWSSASAEAVAAASFSPDPKMVAFASTKTGSTEIWVKPIGNGEPIQVTKDGSYNQYPIWSPDGEEIAFFSTRGDNRGIWRVSFTGGQEVQLLSGVGPSARPLRWTRDNRIVYQDGGELYSADPTTAERRQLTEFKSAGVEPGALSVSLDGALVAFSVREGDGWKVKTKRLDTAALTDIASSKDRISAIAIDPTGKTVLYSSLVDGVMQVFRIATGAAEPTQISTGNSDLFLQDVSADGTKILCSTINETSDLWAADIQSSKEQVVVNDVPEEFWPDISPDGKNVAYQSILQADRPFRGSVLIKSLADPGESRMLSQDGFTPTWSPDGEWIAFLRRTANAISIWKVRATGADATKLVEGDIGTTDYMTVPYLRSGNGTMAWSPDSGSIAYLATTGGISNVWVVPAAGGGAHQITLNTDASETFKSLTWSSDGKTILTTSVIAATQSGARTFRIAAVSLDGGEGFDIYRSPAQISFLGIVGTTQEAVIIERPDLKDVSALPQLAQVHVVSLANRSDRVTSTLTNAYFHNVQLSKDGRTIGFVTRVKGVTDLWTMPALGGPPKKILTQNDPKILISELVWSPDGRSIIFGKQTRTNILSMLTN